MPAEFVNKSELPSEVEGAPKQKEEAKCSGLGCLAVNPLRLVTDFIEATFSNAVTLPRAADEIHTQALVMSSSVSSGIEAGLGEFGSASQALVEGTHEAVVVGQKGLNDLSVGLKNFQETVTDLRRATKETAETVGEVIETGRNVVSVLSSVGKFMDNVAAAGKKIDQTAQATGKFFKAIQPEGSKELEGHSRKEAIAGDVD